MPPSAQCDRRSVLSLQGLNAAMGGLAGTLLPGVRSRRIPVPQTVKRVCVSRRAMACDFTLFFPGEYPWAVDAGCAALDEIERLEDRLSVFRADSVVSHLNRHAYRSPVRVDAELFDLLRRAARLTDETNGAFDIAAGSLVRAWGFFRGPKRVPTVAERRAALAASGMRYVELDAAELTVRYSRPGIEINLGSIGKGYAIDRPLALIREAFGAECVLMQGGRSSLKALGAPADEPRGWKVGVGDPHRAGRHVATVRLKNRALGTSGSAQQGFVEGGRRYGHVLDPRTGWPADELAAASALAADAATADALATAFFVMGIDETRRYCQAHPDIGAVLVTKATANGDAEVLVFGLNGTDIEVGPVSDPSEERVSAGAGP